MVPKLKLDYHLTEGLMGMYKVLIIEDEDMIRNGLKYMVNWVNINCVVVGEATNGQEGLEKIAELSPDIILLDINMPIVNGLDLLQKAIGKYTFSTIILSGYDDFNYAKRAIEYNVTEYLLKPVDHKELIAAVESAKESITLRRKYQLIRSRNINSDNINILNLNVWNNINDKSVHVTKMIEYIQEHYHEKISMQDLVDLLGMSATYLNKKFKENTTYTFNEFLNRYRIQKAIDIIRIGEGKISMIALDVGFSNYRYFIKVFKRYTNLLPSDFS